MFSRRWLKPLVEIRFSRGTVETKKTLLRVRPWEVTVFEAQGKEAESFRKTETDLATRFQSVIAKEKEKDS